MIKHITPKSIEEIISFLNLHQIKVEYKDDNNTLNRWIKFTVEKEDYYIEWWINQSYLQLKKGKGNAKLPFKYIGIHDHSPTSEHRCHLCFYDIPNKKEEFAYSHIPFGAFKIPFNL